ncbi:MAG: hypothetical protein ACREYC_24690 [Gammaproteobacteria bacterium]
MDSGRLSQRTRQPTITPGISLHSSPAWKERKILVWFLRPRFTSLETGRKFFVEVKNKGPAGNADERACKHHTVQFYKTLKGAFGYAYHSFVTVFCESLAVLPRYTRKAAFLFEPDQYFLWVDYDQKTLAAFLRGRCETWVD